MTTTDAPLITHRIGRFTIQVPQGMKKMIQTGSLRNRELREVIWPTEIDTAVIRVSEWEKRLAEIQTMRAPRGEPQIIIEQKKLGDVGRGGGHAVFYYGDSATNRMAFWDVLVDYGSHGLWVKSRSRTELKDSMLSKNLDIVRAYRPLAPDAPLLKEPGFYLEHGVIALPYLEQERTYSRFEGHPLNLKLEIETNEIHKDEPEGENLLGRLAAVLATGFASGVDIEKIRTGKREVGELKGDETVLRAKTKEITNLSFMWRYAGKKDSGDHPEIIIEIDAKDGNLDEKIKLWDAILNSFNPVGP